MKARVPKETPHEVPEEGIDASAKPMRDLKEAGVEFAA